MLKLATKLAKDFTRSANFISHPSYGKKSADKIISEGLDKAFPELTSFEDLTGKQIKELTKHFIKSVKGKESKVVLDDNAKEIKAILEGDCVLFQDIDHSKECIVFDKVDRVLIDIDSEVALKRISKEAREAYHFSSPLGTTEYNPRTTQICWKGRRSRLPITVFNEYVPARWHGEYPQPLPEWRDLPPQLFQDFLDHVIPNRYDQFQFLSWVSWAILERNLSYLLLLGARGIGKSLLMRVVMGIIGNPLFARDNLGSDGFDAEFRNKRIVGIDDNTFIGSKKGHDYRKNLIESDKTRNYKGVQSTKSERQFSSYIICANPSEQFYLDHEERRVICPTLTRVNAKEKFSPLILSFLEGCVNADEEKLTPRQVKFQAQTGHYFLKYALKPQFPNGHQYGGGYFWPKVIESLPSFKRFVVETILSREKDHYGYDELIGNFEEINGGRVQICLWRTLKSFLLDNFRYGDDKICLLASANEQVIYPIDKYTKSGGDDFTGEGDI